MRLINQLGWLEYSKKLDEVERSRFLSRKYTITNSTRTVNNILPSAASRSFANLRQAAVQHDEGSRRRSVCFLTMCANLQDIYVYGVGMIMHICNVLWREQGSHKRGRF